MMRTLKFLLRGIVGALIIVVAVPVAWLAYEVGKEWVFTARFNRIDTGMTEHEVIRRLGPPNERGTKFRLGQYTGFEAEYRRAATIQSKQYLFWFDGDLVYVVGFNDKGEVTMRSYGGT